MRRLDAFCTVKKFWEEQACKHRSVIPSMLEVGNSASNILQPPSHLVLGHEDLSQSYLSTFKSTYKVFDILAQITKSIIQFDGREIVSSSINKLLFNLSFHLSKVNA